MVENSEQNQPSTPQSEGDSTSQSNTSNSKATENSGLATSSSDSQTKEDKDESQLNERPTTQKKRKKKQSIYNIGLREAEVNQILKSGLGDSEPEETQKIDDGLLSEEKEFDYTSTKSLEIRLEIVQKEIDTKNEEDRNLTEEIEYTVSELRLALGQERFRLKKLQQKCEQDRQICRELRENLEKQCQKIKKELEDREQKKREIKEDFEKTQSITANDLFQGDDNIIHTILYVATLFPYLSPNEFKDVVSKFLEGLTREKIKQQKVIEEDKTRIIETSQEESLVKIWEESFSRPDQYLEKCYIIVRRQEKSSLVIDFSSPYLRDELKIYLEEKQFVYVAERLKKVPLLLFHNSENVADRAINLLAEAAVDYPDDYDVEWLLGITEAVENINNERLFNRLSKLIFQIQSRVDLDKSEQMINKFFDRLLLAERSYAFGIVLYLIFRHLCSHWLPNRIELSKQLVDWLKKVLDESEQLEDNNKEENKVNVYRVLEILLWQEKTSSYIYDLLDILKGWLPEKGIGGEDYSSSNQVALFLLARYCEETLLELESDDYGQCPSTYPLFTSLSDDSDFVCRGKLSILVSWLFHSDTDNNSGRNRERNLAFRYVLTIEPIDWIGLLISEWYAILCGQRNDSKNHSARSASSKNKPKLTASEVANNLIRQIILVSEPSEQRKLKEYWVKLVNVYLDKAEEAANSGDEQFKKELLFRRKLVRELIQCFQRIKKEETLSEEQGEQK